MDINKEQLVSLIKKLKAPKILVVGDLALDEMIYGDAERISREAPVLILQHSHTKLILGGASNAAHNVSTLNNHVELSGYQRYRGSEFMRYMGKEFQLGLIHFLDISLLLLTEKQRSLQLDTRCVII